MDGRAKGILPIIKIPFLYYKREDKEVFYPLLHHTIGTKTHLGPAENGIYAYGDLSSLFSTMNRNGSKVCNKKYTGQPPPLFTPKPRDGNHQCETTVLVALVMS